MRWRIVLWISIAANMALAIMLWDGSEMLSGQTELLRRTYYNPAQTNEVRTQVVVRRQFFSWEEVESTNYTAYIENLREIGCPESTIRDIIVADVNQLFARRKAIEIIVPDMEWWHLRQSFDLEAEIGEQLEEIETERRDLLTRLLGPDWEVVTSPPARFVYLNGPVLDQLPPETKEAVQQVAARHERRKERYLSRQEAAGQPPDPRELARIRDEQRQQLATLLTPEQLEAYLLRHSFNADAMRRQLVHFDTTPEEFRAIFRARDPIDHQIQLHYSGSDPASAQKREQLEARREAGIQRLLGEERYAEYRYNLDPVFREARTIADHADVPDELVVPLYEITRAAEIERKRIREDQDISPLERDAALAEADLEVQTTLRQILGDEGWRKYRENTRPQQ